MWPNIEFKVTDRLPKTSSTFDETLKSTDLAFLQYTSGSTGDPKGVMVTSGALLSNVDLIHDGFYKCFEDDGGIPSEIVGFSWLPQYHDLGLIYAAIAPFVGGWRMHMMSPLTFINNPLLWLELMSRHKVSWGVAPNFAFDLVTRRFIKAREKLGGQNPIPGLDLSCLHNLQNGTEPIKLTTRDTFSHVFVKYRLRRNWFHAGYGLAENVVGVCWIHRYHLSTPREEAKLPLVAVGSTKTFHSSLVMKIVDPKTLKEVEGGVIGELWIAGPSVAAGYYGQPDLSKEMFEAKLATSNMTFLRTGDLAFFQDDFLYICGRIKDIIIVNGVNYYPQDIEAAVQEASEAVRPGCVASFSRNEGAGDGMLEIVFEIRKASEQKAESICKDISSAVLAKIGLFPSLIVAIKEKSIPKTTSGKIQRRACRKSLNDCSLKKVFDWSTSIEVVENKNQSDSLTVDGASRVFGGDDSSTASMPVQEIPTDLPTDHLPQAAQ
jgi:acyl-CoA synthetase (AMP-forming)/AMP-acid ligase II